ncbi:MAG: S8 family serine peptidase [Candidatus Poseidoniaceae archaeon]|nr:S8 family serine peptidase [Candidatus Poseidoniaceae archaeon]
MSNTPKRAALMFTFMMLLQVVAPAYAMETEERPDVHIDAVIDLDLLSTVGISPSADLGHGWFAAEDGGGTITLLNRDAQVVPAESWSAWTGQSTPLSGWHVLTHTYPIPTEWREELAQSGIDCFSYLPPNGLHCDLSGQTTSQLIQLNVDGIVKMDATDKLREDLVNAVSGTIDFSPVAYAKKDMAILDLMLSGDKLPEGIEERKDIVVDSHSGRFTTVTAQTSGIVWLANHGAVEFIDLRYIPQLFNTVAATIIQADDIQDGTKMSNANATWNGLDGSGIIVTVGDTGLDNGVNNSAMHPDFADHIKDIVSLPLPPSSCSWASPTNPGPSCDDGAIDDNGHGTHVAGSVLGDGTHSNGGIVGIAKEAQLIVHSIEQGGGLGGIPNNMNDMFQPAYDNGSRIHTNSWGSCGGWNGVTCTIYGLYTTRSAQIDTSANSLTDMVMMFAAGNDASDANGDGERDDDSVIFEAISKNVITIGASETYRPSNGSNADNWSGMAGFSSRGPADDGRYKPDFSTPGTHILSTKSRSAGNCGWGSHNASYCYMGGTSMATPLAAGATALMIQHLEQNRGHNAPTSALIKAIYAATAHDMMGQYTTPANNGAAESAPNVHEGFGLLDMWAAMNASFVADESLSTTDDRGWSLNVPANAPDLRFGLAYNDPAASSSSSTQLVNDLDLAVKDPSGTWTNLSDNLNNMRVLNFASPAQGTWEVHVVGTSVPTGPQFFSLAINAEYDLVNLTQDADFDGTVDESDDCAFTFGTSLHDRRGCPDSDGDGYSDVSSNWTLANGADALPSDNTQWADQDGDGFGDNPSGNEPDACPTFVGTSTADRYGCLDSDGDTYSSPDAGWTTAQGADSCPTVFGSSSQDRTGCPDADADGYSDPDPTGTNGPVWWVSDGADAFATDSSQWNDTDSDGYGDNPPPASNPDGCPSIAGTSTADRLGCLDTDGDGYSDPDATWNASANGADAFPTDVTQWADSDGDGYGDNATGNNADDCPNVSGTSTELGRLGCTDTDGDGYADPTADYSVADGADAFRLDSTQWSDTDGDGFGDNAAGNQPDLCPTVAGTSTRDRHGCPDSDGDGSSDEDLNGTNGPVWSISDGADVWPSDSTQWSDTDSDGYGDNPGGTTPDACINDAGTSTSDRYGCPDSDGDTYSDPDAGWGAAEGADAYPADILRWSDADLDGVADQIDDACPLYAGTSTIDRIGCPDTDGDGVSDPDANWTVDNGSDAFKTDPTQVSDADGDGFGDNASGTLADDCPTQNGNSWQNGTLGCTDLDQDGWADQEDSHPNDITQWSDIDNDGYGDNPGGTTPDACPGVAGNSTNGNRYGCLDTDGDGWDDANDALPNEPGQWLDQDGDGYGDNATGPQPDACPGVPGNSTLDRFGCPDDDGDGMSNMSDAFPNDPTRSQDSDSDGIDDLQDNCVLVPGNSTQDRIGCRDTDGDGYSDPTIAGGNDIDWNESNGADALPLEPTQWADQDGDGYGDNATGVLPDACPTEYGLSNVDVYGCPDGDNDGSSQGNDAFPDDPTQWADQDGDGYGDNPNGTQPDACPTVVGTSSTDRFGCPDDDSDGVSDQSDLWLGDATQWYDTDEDGYGDNPDGTDGDGCPTTYGTSNLGTTRGCPDADNDGYGDDEDKFPYEQSQWSDQDGDGWGDNESAGAFKPDHWPSDPARNSAEGSMECTTIDEIDIVGGGWFNFQCTVTTEIEEVTVRVEWQAMSAITASSQTQVITFTPNSGGSQTITFDGVARYAGTYQLVLVAKEPGSDIAMDTVSISLQAFDSNIVIEEDNSADQSLLSALMENAIVQAALGGLVLFFLMGMLVIRGNASKKKAAEERLERARDLVSQRLERSANAGVDPRRQAFGFGGRVPPPPPGMG